MPKKDLNQVWRTTLAQIEVKLDNPAQFKTFFQGAELVGIEKGKAIISVPNPYTSDWLKQKHESLIEKTISHVYGTELKLTFMVSKQDPAEENKRDTGPLMSSQFGNSSVVTEALTRSGLNDKYKLGNYIVGETNQIAHAAAVAIIDNPGLVYNPLFIHGKTGVGKTHLAQAIGRSVIERNPARRVIYTSSEGFLNDLVKAIRSNQTIEFRKKYRNVQVLIIDDIQLISQWVGTQAEFFNTFNELHNANKQIILIADRRPDEIKDLEDRLRTRFQGGMMVDIVRPNYELRLAILSKKVEDLSLQIEPKLLEVIARGIDDNVRELEGALQKVSLFNQMKPDGDLTTEEVAKIIGADVKTKREKIKVPTVLRAVSKSFDVAAKDIKGPRRTKDVALARQVSMFILREEFSYKLDEIAKFLNRSDHTTVMHAIDKVHSKMLSTEGFKLQVVDIIRDIQNNPANV